MTGICDARDREAVTVLEVAIEIHAVARLRKVLALHRQNRQMLAQRACPHALFMRLAERVELCLADQGVAAGGLPGAAARQRRAPGAEILVVGDLRGSVEIVPHEACGSAAMRMQLLRKEADCER